MTQQQKDVWCIYSTCDDVTPRLRLPALAAGSPAPVLAEHTVPFPSGWWQEPRNGPSGVEGKAQHVSPLCQASEAGLSK